MDKTTWYSFYIGDEIELEYVMSGVSFNIKSIRNDFEEKYKHVPGISYAAKHLYHELGKLILPHVPLSPGILITSLSKPDNKFNWELTAGPYDQNFIAFDVPVDLKDSFESNSHKLPGMDFETDCPVCIKEIAKSEVIISTPLRNVIMHLNDHHKWSREKIADWLDDLHDSGQVNLEFSPWKEGNDDNED